MDNLKEIAIKFKDGLCDSIQLFFHVIYTILRKSRTPEDRQRANMNKRIRQCLYLGVTLLFSMLVFHYVLKFLQYFIVLLGGSDANNLYWVWLEPTLSILFSTFWILPFIVLSRVITTLWFQDIAHLSFRGRQQGFRNISLFIADTFFSIFVQFLFLIQSNLFYLFPIGMIGTFLSIVHVSLLYSLYSFEYKWCNMGWELDRRLDYIEKMWPYFFGFGLPLALVTHYLPNFYWNSAFFSLLFPYWILIANEAHLENTRSTEYKIPFFKLCVSCSDMLLVTFFNRRFNNPNPQAQKRK